MVEVLKEMFRNPFLAVALLIIIVAPMPLWIDMYQNRMVFVQGKKRKKKRKR
jgi:hypothetical protein